MFKDKEKKRNLVEKGFTPTPTLALLQSVFNQVKSSFLNTEEKKSPVVMGYCNKNTTPKLVSGFTLVELLVTLTIFSIMTGIVLYNQQNFNNTIFLNNLAHDIALTARQAQTYGINVKEFAEGTETNKFRSYGVAFNKGFNKNFVLFADNPFPSTNGIFDNSSFTCPNDDSECVDNFIIKNSNYIKSLCSSETVCDLSSLNITFIRPNPDAIITSVDGGGSTNKNLPYAKIIVASENGNTKSIIIRSTGQIYVE